MVHFKSKDNLSPAQVKAFCETGWSYNRSATDVKWLGCAAGYAGLLTLSIWGLIDTSCVWTAYFIPRRREVEFASRRRFFFFMLTPCCCVADGARLDKVEKWPPFAQWHYLLSGLWGDQCLSTNTSLPILCLHGQINTSVNKKFIANRQMKLRWKTMLFI